MANFYLGTGKRNPRTDLTTSYSPSTSKNQITIPELIIPAQVLFHLVALIDLKQQETRSRNL